MSRKTLSGMFLAAGLLLLPMAVSAGEKITIGGAKTDVSAPVSDSQVYTDALITFEYPSDWMLCPSCKPEDNIISLGSSEDALYARPDEFEPGMVQMSIVKSVSALVEQSVDGITPAAYLKNIVANADKTVKFGKVVAAKDGHLAQVNFVNKAMSNLEGLYVAVDLNGDLSLVTAVVAPGDLKPNTDTILSIASTVAAGGMAVEPDTQTVQLDGTWKTKNKNLTISYPTAWVVDESKGILYVSSSDAAAKRPNIDSLKDGEMIAAVFPTLKDLPNIPANAMKKVKWTPDTVVSYYASVGMIDGYQQPDPMDTHNLDDGRQFSSVLNVAKKHERLILSVETSKGNVVTIMAFTAPGQMAAFQDTLTEMILSAK
jgi:hypothetical protein